MRKKDILQFPPRLNQSGLEKPEVLYNFLPLKFEERKAPYEGVHR